MRFQNITRLLGVQTRQDSVDQQAGSLRQADGAVCWPNGALTFSLPWSTAWGVTDLGAMCVAALSPTHTTGTHVVILAAGSHRALVFYSFNVGVVGFFPWGDAGADINFSNTATATSPVSAWAHGLDAGARWYASPIGKALWIGNGVNANLWWDGITVRPLLETPATGQYARAKVAFPPCTSFVIGEQSVVYGAGNVADPQKVWLTERPVASEEYLEGIFSAASVVKLLHQRGTVITALSTWASYVVAHTNNGAVALFGFKQTNDGWLCQQRNSATGAGAVNPYCARGLNGIGTMWLGTDGEIYKDESARTGLEDKIGARDFEIATRNAADGWNRGMDTGTGNPSLSYDPRQGMAWVFAHNSRTAVGSVWAFNEGLGQVTGPYHAPNFVRLVDCGPTKTFTLIGLTDTGRLLYFRPNELNEPASGTLTWPAPALPPNVDTGATPIPPTTFKFVGINKVDGRFFLYNPSPGGGTVRVGVNAPTEDVRLITSGGTVNTYFYNSDLALIEFPLFDMGDVGKEKVIQQAILSWAAQSVGWIGVLAQNEKGHTCWRWLGSIYGKERVIAHLNLIGVRFRLRLFVVSPESRRAVLRDVAVGFLGDGVP